MASTKPSDFIQPLFPYGSEVWYVNNGTLVRAFVAGFWTADDTETHWYKLEIVGKRAKDPAQYLWPISPKAMFATYEDLMNNLAMQQDLLVS